MNEQSIRQVFTFFGVNTVLWNEPLAKHTTWRIGGPADVFVCPHSISELEGAVRAAKSLEMPITVIGRGSNLLVLDGGVRGLVVKLTDAFGEVSVVGTDVTALAGRSFVSLANITIKHNLSGLQFATGIPGTVGGAVTMNAGAHGGEVKDVLVWADVMDESGCVTRLTNENLRFAYRYSLLKDNRLIVVRARFSLQEGDGLTLANTVKSWSIRRNETQPLSLPNCGSVFRNPTPQHAGQLIEEAGLKGFQYGGAQISEKHANFIVNVKGATASDVLWLIRHAQETIRKQFGIELETEVRIIGESASGR